MSLLLDVMMGSVNGVQHGHRKRATSYNRVSAAPMRAYVAIGGRQIVKEVAGEERRDPRRSTALGASGQITRKVYAIITRSQRGIESSTT